jgi:hypothetical protein
MGFVVTILTEAEDGDLRDLAVVLVLIPYNYHHGRSIEP